MNDRDDLELRMMRLEHTQALMLDRLDAIGRTLDRAHDRSPQRPPDGVDVPMGAPAAFAAAPASGNGNALNAPLGASRNTGGFVTLAAVLVGLVALVWLFDELHIDRLFWRFF
jgi:hypothetical protein